MYDLLIKGGEVLDPGRSLRGRLDVAIVGGEIAAIAPGLAESDAREVVDARG